MAGLYVHIPFCKSRCIYCDFYSTTRAWEHSAYVAALCQEIRGRRGEAGSSRVRTIYFGGGTPSQLPASGLRCILQCILDNYDVSPDAEITLEMNPEDVPAVPSLLPQVNRVSLGVQTFDDGLLRLLRRRHTAERARAAVRALQRSGLRNISIDLIYGLPGQSVECWARDLDEAFSLGVQHLSAYALSYETGTPLWQMLQRGAVQEADEELSRRMFTLLCRRARRAGFGHYEISNFALPGFRSRHNSSYWSGEPYLGFGPGAHSFDGCDVRRANRPDLDRYLRHFTAAPPCPVDGGLSAVASSSAVGCEDVCTFERLSEDERYDEAVMCGLRTSSGVNLRRLAATFGSSRADYLLRMARPHLAAGRLLWEADSLRLSEDALMISDDIMSDLMADTH